MEPWILATLVATLLYGLLNFLFKVAAERGHDSDQLVSHVGLTVTLLALATLFAATERPAAAFTAPVFAYAFFNGLFFALGSLAKYGALRRAPAAIVFSLNRLNSVGLVVIGFLFFHEIPRPLQVAGLGAGLGVLFLLVFETRSGYAGARGPAARAGTLLALLSALFTALSMTVGKLLAESPQNRIAYIAVSYALVFLFTRLRAARKPSPAACRPPPPREKFLFGGAIGALNFAGYFLVLQAFGSGPVSLSQAIFSSSILIPVLLSRWIYREKLTPARTAALALAILSVACISWK